MFFTTDQVGAISEQTVREYVRLVNEAGLYGTTAAKLAGVTRITYGQWRRAPPRSLSLGAFLNIRAATKWIQGGLDNGCFPVTSRHEELFYVRQLESGGNKAAPMKGAEATAEEETATDA